MTKGNPKTVNPGLAVLALKRAGGDRKKAFSEYIRLRFQTMGTLLPGCNNADLQTFYDARGLGKEDGK